MLDRISAGENVGLSIILLGVVYVVAWLIQRGLGLLKRSRLPASIVAGFIVLLLGKQGIDGTAVGAGLVPPGVEEVWSAIPGLMISVVFAAIMLGRNLPPLRGLWRAAKPHFIMGTFLSFGQFALGGNCSAAVAGAALRLAAGGRGAD